MKIDIFQKASKYTFYKNDEDNPFLKGRFKSPMFKSTYSEILNLNKEIIATIRIGNSPWFPYFRTKTKVTYIFNFYNPSFEVEVTIRNYSYGHWTFDLNNDHYDFYRHRGHARSLYKNDVQVARYNKRSVKLFQNDRGYIISNNDENELILISLFLAYDMGEYNDADVSYDFGNLLEGKKKIDPDWLPWK